MAVSSAESNFANSAFLERKIVRKCYDISGRSGRLVTSPHFEHTSPKFENGVVDVHESKDGRASQLKGTGILRIVLTSVAVLS